MTMTAASAIVKTDMAILSNYANERYPIDIDFRAN